MSELNTSNHRNTIARVINSTAVNLATVMRAPLEDRVNFVMGAIAQARVVLGALAEHPERLKAFIATDPANNCAMVVSMLSIAVDKYLHFSGCPLDEAKGRWDALARDAIDMGDNTDELNIFDLPITIYHGHCEHDPVDGSAIRSESADMAMCTLDKCASAIYRYISIMPLNDAQFGSTSVREACLLGTVLCASINAYRGMCKMKDLDTFNFTEEALAITQPDRRYSQVRSVTLH